jgi:hypothetical protein
MKKPTILDKYLEAKETLGMNSDAAKFHAENWADGQGLHAEAMTKADLKEILNEKFAIVNAKFVILTTLGGLIFTVCALPYLQFLLGHTK